MKNPSEEAIKAGLAAWYSSPAYLTRDNVSDSMLIAMMRTLAAAYAVDFPVPPVGEPHV